MTADYGAIADRLAAIVAGEPVALIETLAARLAAACLDDEAVREAEITVHKPQAPVDVQFSRHRRDGPPEPRVTGQAGPGPGRTIVLALGSNLGDRLANLQRGLAVLCGGGLRVHRRLGRVPDCPGRRPGAGRLFERRAAGRQRHARHGDPDPLPAGRGSAGTACGQCAGDRGPWTWTSSPAGLRPAPIRELTLPHPRAHERAFVLAPWLDVAPDAALPGYGSVARLLAAAPDRDGVHRLSDATACLTLPAETVPAGTGEEADRTCR